MSCDRGLHCLGALSSFKVCEVGEEVCYNVRNCSVLSVFVCVRVTNRPRSRTKTKTTAETSTATNSEQHCMRSVSSGRLLACSVICPRIHTTYLDCIDNCNSNISIVVVVVVVVIVVILADAYPLLLRNLWKRRTVHLSCHAAW